MGSVNELGRSCEERIGVAAMAERGQTDVKCEVHGVLGRLKDCFGELHSIMTDCSIEERSDVVSSVREMLETGLKRLAEKQEESELKSKQMTSRGAGICTHSCVHHAEIVNPEVWSNLTEDLVARVFARLPIPRIIELRKSSKAWAAMLDSASFKSPFAEVNPKLLGLLGWDRNDENFRIRILDAAVKEWHAIELDIPKGENYNDSVNEENMHRDFLYSCDGGLVCLIPGVDECFDGVYVGNPLTEVWRKLPDILVGYQDPVLVQLLTNELFYRVIMVYSDMPDGDGEVTHEAVVYDSGTGSWSVMNSGMVYGMGATFQRSNHSNHYPLIFDSTMKLLIVPQNCAAVQGLIRLRASILKDRLFVLHVLIDRESLGNDSYVISEFTLVGDRPDVRKVNDYEVPFEEPGLDGRSPDVEFLTSTGFIVSTWDIQPDHGRAHQVIRIYDVSAGQWHDLPSFLDDREVRNRDHDGMFMCELRWDANP